ncbi:Nuclear cap-binding protein subunit 1 [Dimargaris xerosporica]|nr:Nuclear cap-binding protein subunit 1 [Dimargaris xerosporica]
MEDHSSPREVDQFGRIVRRSTTAPRSKPYDRPPQARRRHPYGQDFQRGRGRDVGRGMRSGSGPPMSAHDQHRIEMEELEKRLSSLILKVGDKLSSSLGFNIEALVGVLGKDYHRHSEVVLRAFQGVITELPVKTETYATLVGLLNVRYPDIAAAIVAMAWEQLTESIRDLRRWKIVKLWLRFFACLVAVHVVAPQTMMGLLTRLRLAVERDDPNIQDTKRADALMYLILVTLPWVGGHLAQAAPVDLQALLDTLRQYVERGGQPAPSELLAVFPGLTQLPSDRAGPAVQYHQAPVRYLYLQIVQLQLRNWETLLLHRTYERFADQLQGGQLHDLLVASLELPAPSSPFALVNQPLPSDVEDLNPTGKALESSVKPLQAALKSTYAAKYPYHDLMPVAWLPLFADPPSALALEHFLVHDQVIDIMDIFHTNRKDAVNYLAQLPLMMSDTLCQQPPARNASQDPNAKPAAHDPSKLNADYIIVSALFAHLFELPSPPQRPLYYGALAIELCRLAPERFLQLLVDAITQLFHTMPRTVPWTHGLEEAVMHNEQGTALLPLVANNDATAIGWDLECLHRFADWFSVYLSNSGFQWDWAQWQTALTVAEPTSPCLVFARETVAKCVRLSYLDRLKIMIPEALQGLLMPQFQIDPVFRYAPANNSATANGQPVVPPALQSFATELLGQLRKKQPVEVIEAFLENAYQNDLATVPAEDLLPVAVASSRVYTLSSDQPLVGADGSDELSLAADQNVLTRTVRDVFVQCLLFLGCKSFSHMLNVIERYLPLLQKFSADGEAKRHIVEVVNDFWQLNPQFLTIIIDKLLNYRVIDPSAVITWALNPRRLVLSYPAPFYVWEVLRSTVSKIDTRIGQIERRLTRQRALLAAEGVTVSDVLQNPAMHSQQTPALAESITHLETTHTSLKLEHKELLLSLFQNFASLLTTITNDCSTRQIDPFMAYPYLWMEGRFHEMLRTYHRHIRALTTTMEAIVFTDEVSPRIREAFKQAREL